MHCLSYNYKMVVRLFLLGLKRKEKVNKILTIFSLFSHDRNITFQLEGLLYNVNTIQNRIEKD